MTTITLKNLTPQLLQRLQQQASLHGRELEAEIAAILTSALTPASPAEIDEDLPTAIQKHFADLGGFELPEIPREPIREPPTF